MEGGNAFFLSPLRLAFILLLRLTCVHLGRGKTQDPASKADVKAMGEGEERQAVLSPCTWLQGVAQRLWREGISVNIQGTDRSLEFCFLQWWTGHLTEMIP